VLRRQAEHGRIKLRAAILQIGPEPVLGGDGHARVLLTICSKIVNEDRAGWIENSGFMGMIGVAHEGIFCKIMDCLFKN